MAAKLGHLRHVTVTVRLALAAAGVNHLAIDAAALLSARAGRSVRCPRGPGLVLKAAAGDNDQLRLRDHRAGADGRSCAQAAAR